MFKSLIFVFFTERQIDRLKRIVDAKIQYIPISNPTTPFYFCRNFSYAKWQKQQHFNTSIQAIEQRDRFSRLYPPFGYLYIIDVITNSKFTSSANASLPLQCFNATCIIACVIYAIEHFGVFLHLIFFLKKTIRTNKITVTTWCHWHSTNNVTWNVTN